MITSRDIEIKEFLQEFKIANTTTIASLFFPSISACQKRLKIMIESKEIRRDRDSINNEFIYYVKRPKQYKHSLLVTKFYNYIYAESEIIKFKTEPVLGDIRPDALFGYIKDGKKCLGLLEVEISNKGFNYTKYEKFYSSGNYKLYFPVMPTIYIVGDKIKLPESQLNFINISIKSLN